MEAKVGRRVLILLILSIALAVLGQYYFAHKRSFMWDGIVLYLLAMALFVSVSAALEPQRRKEGPGWPNLWQELWQALRCSRLRLVVLLMGLAMILYVTSASGSRPGDKPFWDLLALWVISIALVVGAFVDWGGIPEWLQRGLGALRRHGPETVLVLFIAVITFLLRGINREGIPFVLSGDEAEMGLEAIAVLEGRRTSPFVTGWLSHPTLYFFLQAAFLRLFGITTAALRLPSALISAATVILLYLLARRFYGRWIALLAAISFAFYHYAIHFGRLAINNIWDPFFALGVFYFFIRGIEEKRLGHMLAAGVFGGLAVYFYMGARLIPIILFVYVLYCLFSKPGFLRDHLVYLVICGLVALVIALPLLSFFRTHPNDMMARWNSMGIFPSGWVEQQRQATGRSTLSIFLGQFLKAALAFNFFSDPTFWYHPGIPLLQFLSSVFFVFGLTYAIYQWRRREYFLLCVWFLLVILFGGALLENPPTSPRLVLAIPPVVICMVLGMVKVSSYIQLALEQPRSTALILSLALVLLTSYQSAHFYFARYTPAHEFAGVNTEVADRMGKYLKALGPEYQCYFFGAPRMYYGHATIPFIARGIVGTDVTEPITDSVAFVNPERKAVFVFLPERLGELDVVRRFYPTGRLREFRNKNGQVLFVAYEAD
jgi:hypothetical protein